VFHVDGNDCGGLKPLECGHKPAFDGSCWVCGRSGKAFTAIWNGGGQLGNKDAFHNKSLKEEIEAMRPTKETEKDWSPVGSRWV
jgi:hypothetical protein